MLTFKQYIKEIKSNLNMDREEPEESNFKKYPNRMGDLYDKGRTPRIDPSVTTGGITPKSNVIDPDDIVNKTAPQTTGKFGIK